MASRRVLLERSDSADPKPEQRQGRISVLRAIGLIRFVEFEYALHDIARLPD
ncbi:MAG: hypothetical protein L6R00_20275 [Phycisphaerae bacterium]|nr:hypothetical protein [Phycisphaerae bacterium]